jgi:MFS family permease
MYLSAPVSFGILKKYPNIRRPCVTIGLFIMCLALAASSFSQTVTHLILTQGIGYAMGGAIAYTPVILFVDEWFIKRKGLAFGIMWAGTGVVGFAIPLVMQWLLEDYGFRTALRAWSLTLAILTGPLLYCVKPRVPIQHSEREHAPGKLFDWSFVLSPQFLIFEICNVVEALGYFLPGIYLPNFTQQAFGTSKLASALTVICLNIASVFGCVIMGFLIDRYHVTTCILISTIGSTIGVFLLWGVSTNLPMIYLFSVVYGLFAGSFSSTWTGIISYVKGKTESADPALVFAALAFGRGVGNVASGPLSEVLVKGRPWMGEAALAYGSGYGPLIVFTGISAMIGGASFLVRKTGHI